MSMHGLNKTPLKGHIEKPGTQKVLNYLVECHTALESMIRSSEKSDFQPFSSGRHPNDSKRTLVLRPKRSALWKHKSSTPQNKVVRPNT